MTSDVQICEFNLSCCLSDDETDEIGKISPATPTFELAQFQLSQIQSDFLMLTLSYPSRLID